MKLIIGLAVVTAVLSAATPIAAQTYPFRTVNIVVPYPAGGSVDGVARILAQKLSDSFDSSFIVENRAGGAGGTVGANAVAKAQPDGYTLMLTASVHVTTPFLFKNIPYDVVKDFTPITLVAAGPLVVSTAPNVPANNLKEFFELVRKTPDKFTFATSSFGSAGHLAIELLKRQAGVNTLVIAYKGAGPMLNDIMGGQIQLIADPMLSSLPLAQAKKIKALAITSLKRVPAAPEIPTVEESGLEKLEFVSWYGLWGPKDMPADLVAKIQSHAVKVLAQPEVKQKMGVLGFEAIGTTPAEFAKFIDKEMATYSKIIKDAKIKAE
ncbi:MAG TPA: tripartite tricarboxylate transporter substrate-binding protein [Bradyrhizobium sp.]